MKKKKLVILCVYPHGGAPSQRFRFEQQLPFIKNKYQIKQLSFWSEKTNNLLYNKGNLIKKILGIITGLTRRVFHLFQCINADVIFIHREIIPLGSIIFESILKTIFKKTIIFDFDDAIWNIDTSNENKKFEWVKSSRKTEKIIKISTSIITGNQFLYNYAKQFNTNITVIPTTIDTSYHKPRLISNSSPICIGWTGSKTTIKHFEILIPVLIKLKKKYKDLIKFKLIGDPNYQNKELNLVGTAWNKDTEIADLQELDIGIMPLPNDEWAKGKCGFKGLQYMALEIPTIMSPVGVNTEIITEGVNGFLANTESEWVDKLSLLIESKILRNNIGKEGRRTIIKRYSIVANKKKYLTLFEKLLG